MDLLKDSETSHFGLGKAQGLEFGRPHCHQAAQILGFEKDFFRPPRLRAVKHGLNDLCVREGLGTIKGHAFGNGEAPGRWGFGRRLLVE
jgi:hypothetical protein